jgi:transcriptional regulator with XRE-family HTH domain
MDDERTYLNAGQQLLAGWFDASGRTQQDLARMLGVGQTLVSTWVVGRSVPGLANALRLRDVLEIPVDAWLAPPVGRDGVAA